MPGFGGGVTRCPRCQNTVQLITVLHVLLREASSPPSRRRPERIVRRSIILDPAAALGAFARR